MGMNVGSSGGSAKPDINVTPLVDVVLVLLIIFMVVTPLLEKEMPMKLPEIEQKDDLNPPPPDPNDENLVLYVTKDDQIKYNGSVIQIADIDSKLGPLLRSKDKDNKDRVLFFTADDDAKYDFGIHVLDAARASGARTIAYLTDVPEGAGGAPPAVPAAPGEPTPAPTPAPAPAPGKSK